MSFIKCYKHSNLLLLLLDECSSCTQSLQLLTKYFKTDQILQLGYGTRLHCLHVDVKVVIVLSLRPSIFEFCSGLLILSLDIWDKSYSGFCVLISYYLFICFYSYFLVSCLIMLVPFGALSVTSVSCPQCPSIQSFVSAYRFILFVLSFMTCYLTCSTLWFCIKRCL